MEYGHLPSSAQARQLSPSIIIKGGCLFVPAISHHARTYLLNVPTTPLRPESGKHGYEGDKLTSGDVNCRYVTRQSDGPLATFI
ncbi:hypothetical protein CEXT_412591 [Caerostris extrusa]|uniref:Uncharacterized protein n=1 Tax=Caerostris extrusa TaxID=172846 RepID=A0AAV4ST75_CAEEX|nr:hypothetical protein CEXT_412591 [Caerostris extrusa]